MFLGPVRDDYPANPHDPGPGMWLPPAILVVLVVVIGVAPFLVQDFVILVAKSVIGGTAELKVKYIKIWHGLVPALYMSIAAVVGGLLLMAIYRPALRLWDATPRPEAKVIFEAIIAGAVATGAPPDTSPA